MFFRFRGFSALVSMALLTSAAAVQAQSTTYYQNADFTVNRYQGESGCQIFSAYSHKRDGDIFFSVDYDAKDKKVQLSVSSEITTSLPDEGEVEMEITFLNNGDTRYDDGWGTRKFYYSKGEGMYVFSAFFKGSENVTQILDDLSHSETLGIFYQDKLFQAIPLKGSALAVQKLKACSFEAAGLNPRDPFAQ